MVVENCDKYSRYQIGYNFRNEQEHRIVFNDNEKYLYFDEEGFFMIITPNDESKIRVENYLKANWERPPIVKIFPS